MVWILLGGSVILAATVMLVIYRDAMQRGKIDGVDIGWAAVIVSSSWWYAAAQALESEIAPSGWLVLVLLTVWGVRLMGHLYFDRLIQAQEDGRYKDLKAGWANNLERNIRYFFVAQALLGVIFSLVALAAIRAGTSSSLVLLIGLSLFLIGFLGEAIADRQLARFRAQPQNKGKVCNVGLWRYSRHPNYFFDWLMWLSYVPLAGSLWWLALIPGALLLYLFLFVTGIPPTEAQSLRSRGDAYREYQRTTSAFIPLPPKRG